MTNLQIVVHVLHPPPSADSRQKGYPLPDFYSGATGDPAASVRDYCSGAYKLPESFAQAAEAPALKSSKNIVPALAELARKVAVAKASHVRTILKPPHPSRCLLTVQIMTLLAPCHPVEQPTLCLVNQFLKQGSYSVIVVTGKPRELGIRGGRDDELQTDPRPGHEMSLSEGGH
jgi:hypothetical protein